MPRAVFLFARIIVGNVFGGRTIGAWHHYVQFVRRTAKQDIKQYD